MSIRPANRTHHLKFLPSLFKSFYFIVFTFACMCIHCLCHLPFPLAHSPTASRQNPICPLVLRFCWRESKDDKDKMCLPIWNKDSYTERFLALLPWTCVLLTHIDSSLADLFITSWSPFHSGLFQFKIAIFSPLQWAYQPHSNFRLPSLCLFLQCVFSP
jgi:hypothetical protein